jgi:hypothetical protein
MFRYGPAPGKWPCAGVGEELLPACFQARFALLALLAVCQVRCGSLIALLAVCMHVRLTDRRSAVASLLRCTVASFTRGALTTECAQHLGNHDLKGASCRLLGRSSPPSRQPASIRRAVSSEESLLRGSVG